ncbi:MAG TPA: hypothetical protein PLX84_15865, partial [Acidiphilium sp.]|nr:hypothetical protein [Acidiphilium sp.]
DKPRRPRSVSALQHFVAKPRRSPSRDCDRRSTRLGFIEMTQKSPAGSPAGQSTGRLHVWETSGSEDPYPVGQDRMANGIAAETRGRDQPASLSDNIRNAPEKG